MSDTVKIDGFDHIIREAVQKRIEASIAESLVTERDGIVERVVGVALNAKVKDGWKEVSFLDKLARDTIQKATQDVVKEWVGSLVPTIRAEIERQLGTKAVQKQIASEMVAQFIRTGTSHYNIKVAFETPRES